MNMQPAAAPRAGMGWLGPVAVGVALVGVAFFAASYIARPSGGGDPFEEVIADLEAQVRADPQNGALRVTVADAYLKADRPQESLIQYEEALRIDGEREDALYGMGMAYMELGDSAQAAAAFQAIVEGNKDNPSGAVNRRVQGSHFYLGILLREAGQYEDAINELRTALGLNRADADTLFELGKTFAMAGNVEDAIAAFDIALAYVPDYREAYVEMESLAAAQGDDARANFAHAMLLVLDDKPDEALSILKPLAEESESARFWWGLGYASELTGDNAGAIEAFKKSVAINPGELLAAEALRRLEEGGEP